MILSSFQRKAAGGRRGGRRRAACPAGLCLIALMLVARAGAQSPAPLPSASALKKLTFEQLMDLDVTSVSKRPEKLFETASAVQVITADDIRRSGATRLPEALRLASNLEVAQIDSRQWAITARGFNNVFADKMLVLIDGRSVYTPLYAGVYWDVQDTLIEDIDRIEVISGPGATQWGANAVNGVINVTTKSAKDTQGGLLLGGAGRELSDSAGVRYGGQLAPGVYYRVYGKYFERSNTVRPFGEPFDDGWRMTQGGFRVDWDVNRGTTATLQGDAYRGVMGQTGPDNIVANGQNVLGRWSRVLSPTSDVKIQMYYDRTYRSIPGSFTQTLNTGDFDFQHHWQPLEGQNIVWGAGYRVVADDILNTPANAFLPANVTREWFNAFVQDEIVLSKDALVLTLGTKVEHDAYTDYQFSPSVRLAWTPDKQNTLWGAASRAVRTPSRVDRDLYSPAEPPYRVAGGSDVVSEKLISLEFGYRVQLNPKLVLSLATYYSDYDDLRSLEPIKPPLAFPVNQSSGLQGYATGAELTAEWSVAPSWRLRAGWTEMRVHSEPQPGTQDRGTRDSIARDPNHQFSLRSLWDLATDWELDADFRYVAKIGSQSVPGYAELNLRLGWSPTPTWEFSVLGQNLLHDQHAEFNPPGSRRELQRGFYTKASWRF